MSSDYHYSYYYHYYHYYYHATAHGELLPLPQRAVLAVARQTVLHQGHVGDVLQRVGQPEPLLREVR